MASEFAGVLRDGSKIFEYEIIRVLGRPGGFGVTYLATDTHLSKEVAIKEFLPTEFAIRLDDVSVTVRSQDDREAFAWGLKNFLNEARVLARFSHPNLVKVHRFFEAHGTAYIVMEFVDGETLSELLKREGSLDEARIRRILEPIADGLEVVHKAGVLHRDVKPENILIRPDGTPVLIDFGASRNSLGSKSKSILNVLTAGYAPIEQYSEKDNQGAWTDIYALGAVAYRMVTSRKPLDAVSRLHDDPLEPATRAGAERYSKTFLAAIDWALTMRHQERPQSAAQWRQALTSAPAAAGVGAESPTEIWSPSRIEQALDAVPKSQPPAADPLYVAPRTAGIRQGGPAKTAERVSPERKKVPVAAILGIGLLAIGAVGAAIWLLRSPQPEVVAISTSPPVTPAVDAETPAAVATNAEPAPATVTPAAPVEAVAAPVEKPQEPPKEISKEIPKEIPREAAASEAAAEIAYWQSIQNSSNPELFRAYLKRYPKGSFVELARSNLKSLAASASPPKSAAAPATVTPAPLPATAAAVSPPAAKPEPPAQAPVETAAAGKSASGNEIVVDRSSSLEGRKPGQSFRDCADCPEMVVIPAGRFGMGSPAGETGRGYDEGPQHVVVITGAFAMSRHEITFDQWDQCVSEGGCAARPSDRGWGRGKRPVINVSWSDSSGFLQWLNKKSGKKYRLPSEAEWEYAARAGSGEANAWREDASQACRYSNGPDQVTLEKYAETVAANCRDNYAETAPVGSFSGNEFGLNDMLGNVWEWTADCYQDSYAGTPADGSPMSAGDCSNRTLRGGGWNGNARDLRVANRLKNSAGGRLFVAGFRVVRGE